MEQLWHYNQHPHAHQSIQHQVAQCLAQHQTHRTSPCPLNQLGMQRSPFAGRTVYQSYTQKQRLLDDQHQHSRNQETGKPVRRIEQSHTLVQQRCGRHFILPHGGIPHPFDLQFGVHIQRHVRTRRQQRFVVKQSAHVAVQTDIRLLHPVDLTAEIIRNTDDAICFRAAHQFFRLFHISRPRHDFYIGRSIDPADKVAAESRIRPIDNDRRNFPDRFSRINKSIEQGIKYRYQNKKDQYSLVTHHATGFLTPYKKRITDSLTE